MIGTLRGALRCFSIILRAAQQCSGKHRLVQFSNVRGCVSFAKYIFINTISIITCNRVHYRCTGVTRGGRAGREEQEYTRVLYRQLTVSKRSGQGVYTLLHLLQKYNAVH